MSKIEAPIATPVVDGGRGLPHQLQPRRGPPGRPPGGPGLGPPGGGPTRGGGSGPQLPFPKGPPPPRGPPRGLPIPMPPPLRRGGMGPGPGAGPAPLGPPGGFSGGVPMARTVGGAIMAGKGSGPPGSSSGPGMGPPALSPPGRGWRSSLPTNLLGSPGGGSNTSNGGGGGLTLSQPWERSPISPKRIASPSSGGPSPGRKIISPGRQPRHINRPISPKSPEALERLGLLRNNKSNNDSSGPIGPPPSHIKSHAPSLKAPPRQPFGKLTVKVMACGDLKTGHGAGGKADPYVRIKVGETEVVTPLDPKGRKEPVWDKDLEFDILTEQEMELEVFHKKIIGEDESMGRAKVSILDWIAQGKYSGKIDLLDDTRKLAGYLELSANFYRTELATRSGPGLGPGSKPKPVPTPPSSQGAVRATSPLPPEPEPTAPIDPSNNLFAASGDSKSFGGHDGNFSDDEILGAFRAFDLDKNNYVGAAEIRHVLVNIGERVTDEEIDEMIRMVDRDGDGQVSFGEFYKMVSGGNAAPPGIGRDQRSTSIIPGSDVSAVPRSSSSNSVHNMIGSRQAPPPPTGPAVVQARNKKRKALDEFSRDNNLRPESIKRAHKRCQAIDKNKSGVIDYTEFCEILQAEPNEQSEGLFALYDYDKAGLIDSKEILIALASFTGAGKEDKLKFAFLLFDEENNGVITKAELIKILKANHLAKVDAEVARKVETIMAQADRQGDGIIAYDEFISTSKKFPNILFPARS